jgi:hypothetical protein
VQAWGGTAFTWTDGDGKPMAGTTIWSIIVSVSDDSIFSHDGLSLVDEAQGIRFAG